MKMRTLQYLALVALAGCIDEDLNKNSPEMAATMASRLCGTSTADLQWLQELMQNSQTDITLQGDLYAVRMEGRVIFVHQPLIMSCLACVLYDCEGNPIDVSTIDREKLREGMNPSSRIYTPLPL
jgi:hypothetical protein